MAFGLVCSTREAASGELPKGSYSSAALVFKSRYHVSASLRAQFETRASVPVLSNPISIATGDFNRDGKLDLAVAAFFNGKVAVLLGRGDGTFEPATYYTVGANETTGSIVAANLRRADLLDLVVTNDLSNEVQVLFGNGDGTFGPAVAYSTPNYPAAIELGDFTGDHKLDVVTVDESGYCPCISVLLGNGRQDATFQEPPLYHDPPGDARGRRFWRF